MTILVTGGTGKTGLVLSRLLKEANQSLLIASRSGTAPSPYKAVKFDWFDDKTFENPFNADSSIDRVYLVLPSVPDRPTKAKQFIDLAISKGVKRFVLLSATQESPAIAEVHKYLLEIKIDYAVLRPTWFMGACIPTRFPRYSTSVNPLFAENFGNSFCQSIREQNEISGLAKGGRVPFISVEDIAQVAYDALFAKERPNKDYYIVGPELFSYDEVSESCMNEINR